MKIILATRLVLSLAQAWQVQDSKIELSTEMQKQSLELALEAILMIERLMAKDLTTE